MLLMLHYASQQHRVSCKRLITKPDNVSSCLCADTVANTPQSLDIRWQTANGTVVTLVTLSSSLTGSSAYGSE